MFACLQHVVTKQCAGIDTDLDILILLDLMFTVQQGAVSLALSLLLTTVACKDEKAA